MHRVRILGLLVSVMLMAAPLQECAPTTPPPPPSSTSTTVTVPPIPPTVPPTSSTSTLPPTSTTPTFPPTITTPPTPPPPPPVESPTSCPGTAGFLAGPDTATPFITGNASDADRQCRSYQAMLYSGGLRCGGTLISDEWILTAAHCLIFFPGPYTIRLGAYSSSGDDGQEFQVAEQVTFPEYLVTPEGVYKDMALIRINGQADPSLVRAALPTPALEAELGAPGRQVVFTGWGLDGVPGSIAPVLREAVHTLQDPALCGIPDPANNNCVTVPQPLPCKGDSGGPSVAARNGRIYVLAVASFGDGECRTNASSTRIGPYLQWITDTTGITPVG